jgi:hypothetical protein
MVRQPNPCQPVPFVRGCCYGHFVDAVYVIAVMRLPETDFENVSENRQKLDAASRAIDDLKSGCTPHVSPMSQAAQAEFSSRFATG